LEKTDDRLKIEKGLRKIRRAKRVMLLLFIGFLPYGILSSLLSEKLKMSIMFFIGAYFVLVIVFNYYFGLTSKCPRCNEFYYWRMSGIGYRNFFIKKCLNCGLELNGLMTTKQKF
jgi:hypothetical protein